MTSPVYCIDGEYTRRVGGETYQYEARYSEGAHSAWFARVYLDGNIKGTPSGSLFGNTLKGDALRQYLISYIEGIIERELDIAE